MADEGIELVQKIDAGLRRWYEYCGKGDDYNYDGTDQGVFDWFCEESLVFNHQRYHRICIYQP